MLNERGKVDLLMPLLGNIKGIENTLKGCLEKGAHGIYLVERDVYKSHFIICKEGCESDIGSIETKGVYGEVSYVEVCNVDYFESVSHLISVLRTAPNILLQMKLIGLVKESR